MGNRQEFRQFAAPFKKGRPRTFQQGRIAPLPDHAPR